MRWRLWRRQVPALQRWCDEYFILWHRNEQRGVGGVFFDDFSELALSAAWHDAGRGHAFLGAYLPIVEKRQNTAYGERERDFQPYRRGRYVEFNLVWDRVRTSACSRAVVPNRSCCPCRRWLAGEYRRGEPEAP